MGEIMKFSELVSKIIIYDKRKNKNIDVCSYFDDLEKGDFVKRIIEYR